MIEKDRIKSDKEIEVELNIKNRKSWLIIVVTGIIVSVFSYKIYTLDFSQIELDMGTFLSIMVSFFAIFLSVIFYFKADEANNRFYHQTYEFIKDTSTILGEIKALFGEKMENLKEQLDLKKEMQINMRSMFSPKEVTENEKVDQNKQEEKKKDQEIRNLIEKTVKDEKEKKKLLEKIAEKEEIIEKQKEENEKERLEYVLYYLPIAILDGFLNYIYLNVGKTKISDVIKEKDIQTLVDYFMGFLTDNRGAERIFIAQGHTYHALEKIIDVNYKMLKRRYEEQF